MIILKVILAFVCLTVALVVFGVFLVAAIASTFEVDFNELPIVTEQDEKGIYHYYERKADGSKGDEIWL